MPEEVKQKTLRPAYKLSRDEVAKLIETATGQKPADGFHSLTVTMAMDGESGQVTWVDAANRPNQIAKAQKPKIPKGNLGNNTTNG